MKEIKNNLGFSLIELAVAILIISLLLFGLLGPLRSKIEQKERQDNKEMLEEIHNALIGYAITNGFLPCPTTQTDPANVGYGVANAAACGAEGFLPWKDLGMTEVDVWGRARANNAEPMNGVWRYRVDTAFDQTAVPPFQITDPTLDGIVVQNANGNRLSSAGNPPVAVVYSLGSNFAGELQNVNITDTTYTQNTRQVNFDDMLVWISRQSLIYRMVQSGQLP